MQRDEYTDAMTRAINAAKRLAAIERFYKVVGGGAGLAARIFALPWLATVAWNGMTPENWARWEYLPTVAAFLVFSVLVNMLRGPSK